MGTPVSAATYLDTSYSPDRHYIHGQLVERSVGEKEHGRIQRALIRYLTRYREQGLEAWPEQRIQIGPDHYRVVDVCITEGEPEEQVFTAAPLVCIEILSRRDSLGEVQEVVDDYLAIGVPYIWVINPWKRLAYVATSRGFDRVAGLTLRTEPPHPELVISVDDLYKL